MLANKRMANTKCLINSPNSSRAKISGFSTMPMAHGTSMGGTWPSQKPNGPSFTEPATTTVTNVITANAAVVAKAPVGEPAQGTNPSKLQINTKKKMFNRNGCKPVPVMRANRRTCHLIADEQHHGLEQIRQSTLRPGTRFEPASQGNKYRHQDQAPTTSRDHELGDLQVQRFDQVVDRRNARLELQDGILRARNCGMYSLPSVWGLNTRGSRK